MDSLATCHHNAGELRLSNPVSLLPALIIMVIGMSTVLILLGILFICTSLISRCIKQQVQPILQPDSMATNKSSIQNLQLVASVTAVHHHREMMHKDQGVS